MPVRVYTGLERIEKSWPKDLYRTNVGLLAHPASINSRFEHASDLILKSRRLKLMALFGPQHGMRGETQDNMIEWKGYRDRKTGLAVFSLYGKTRMPEPGMLRNLDVMVIDLQDVGSRYYTYIWTMALVMQACQQLSRAVVVLDRPNPIGGHLIEGAVLRQDFASFVGLHPLPVRHGMTLGEIALYLQDRYYPSLQLYVIPMKGWRRALWFDETGLPWVYPSPNIPTPESACVYPGICLLEGTNVSEGRGTTRPFEIFGAPYIEPDTLVKRLREYRLKGVVFRPLHYIPTFHKYSGKLCGGVQIHVTERERYRPFKTAVGILKSVRELYPRQFAWRKPPYEYEEKHLPFDILAGCEWLRKDIDRGMSLKMMESCWSGETREFDKTIRRKYLLYQWKK